MDLALNILQRLICHKTQTTNQPSLKTVAFAKFKSHIAMRVAETDCI